MNLDEEREAFEAWFESNFESTKLHKFDDGVYWHERAQMSWEAWQAAKAQEAENLKGCVVIPFEPTDEIIEAMDQFDSNFGYADMRSAYKAIVKSARGGK